MTINNHNRPKYLNLFKIWMPITAVTSILHRLSGVLLFISIPVLIYTLQEILRDEASYKSILECFDHIFVKGFVLVLLWAVLHHLLAGIRFLIIDFDIGVNKSIARASAWAVTFIAFGLFVVIVWRALL